MGPDGTMYTNIDKDGASLARFDTTLRFDPDGETIDMCNLYAETTAIVQIDTNHVPTDKLAGVTLPQSFWRDAIGLEPKTYVWELKNTDGSYTKYIMSEEKAKWFVTFTAEPTTGPEIGTRDEAQNRYYKDWDIWFEFEMNEDNWYFDGSQKEVYFAIASINLVNYKTTGLTATGAEIQPRDGISWSPQGMGTPMYIYYDEFGNEKATTTAELQSFATRETTLNSRYFRPKVYGHISLNDFGVTENWSNIFAPTATGDSLTLAFDVNLFVVGEWRAKDRTDLPDDYGRIVKKTTTTFLDFSAITDFLSEFISKPVAWLTTMIVFGGIVLIAMTIYGSRERHGT